MAKVKAVWTSRRLQRALLDRTRARTWWGAGGRGEPRVSSLNPHLLFIALRDGGPSTRRMAGRPRSERESGAQLTIEPTDEDQCNSMQSRKAR